VWSANKEGFSVAAVELEEVVLLQPFSPQDRRSRVGFFRMGRMTATLRAGGTQPEKGKVHNVGDERTET